MLGPTVEELYESFMDEKFADKENIYARPFAEDVYHFFGTESKYSPQEFASKYGQYFAPFDTTGVELGERERDLDYKKARILLDSTEEATDRVYKSEMDTLGTDIRKQMNKGRVLAGRAGLRSGTLEQAMDDTLSMSYEKSKDLGDRLILAKEESKNKYNTAMVDAALDYDKTVSQEKQDFYDRTMSTVMRLSDQGAFTPYDSEESGEFVGDIQEEEGTFCYNYCAEIFGWTDPIGGEIGQDTRTRSGEGSGFWDLPTTNMQNCITECKSG